MNTVVDINFSKFEITKQSGNLVLSLLSFEIKEIFSTKKGNEKEMTSLQLSVDSYISILNVIL